MFHPASFRRCFEGFVCLRLASRLIYRRRLFASSSLIRKATRCAGSRFEAPMKQLRLTVSEVSEASRFCKQKGSCCSSKSEQPALNFVIQKTPACVNLSNSASEK